MGHVFRSERPGATTAMQAYFSTQMKADYLR